MYLRIITMISVLALTAVAGVTVDDFEAGFAGTFSADGGATMERTGGEGVTQGSWALKITLPAQPDAAAPRQRANLLYELEPGSVDWAGDHFRMDAMVMGTMPFSGIYLLTDDGYRVAYLNDITGGVDLAMSQFYPEGGGEFAWERVRQLQISFFSNPGAGGSRIILDRLEFTVVDGPDYSNLYYVEN